MLKILRLIYFPLSILIVSLLLLPVCILRPFSAKNTALYLNLLYWFSRPMGISFKVEGIEKLDSKPAVIIGNHQHNFDIIMASFIFKKDIVALGKREIAFIPLFGTVFWLAGNILISRGKKQSSQKTMSKVKNYLITKKLGLVIFPEGHRNTEKELLIFKKGAFKTAIETQIPIIIFGVEQYANKLQLNKFNAGRFKITILDPISTENKSLEDLDLLIANCREKLIEII